MENEQTVPTSSAGKATGTTVGQAKETWSEVMFYLALFFGVLHFSAILMQVVGMFAHTALRKEFAVPFQSSVMMGNVYLAFLAAYVGQKEFVRWLKRADDEILSGTDAKKVTRGIYIVIIWAVFTGVVMYVKSMSFIAEVPDTLYYTLGEVLALLCGTEASKYLRNRQATKRNQTASSIENYGDRAIDLCKAKGSIDNELCQMEFGLSRDQAYRLLNKLENTGKIKAVGMGKATKYIES